MFRNAHPEIAMTENQLHMTSLQKHGGMQAKPEFLKKNFLPENQTDFHLDQMPDGVSREHFQNEVLGEDARKIYRHFSSIIDLILKHKQPFGLSKRCKLHRPAG